MQEKLLCILIGLISGTVSGLIGIGGGIIIIPAMVYVLGMSQHLAQGTTLALMIPPIGLLAAYVYFRHGDVNIPVAICVGIGFFIGAGIGARFAEFISDAALNRIFGIALLFISLYIIFKQ